MSNKENRRSNRVLKIAGTLGFAAIGLAANYFYNVALKRGHERVKFRDHSAENNIILKDPPVEKSKLPESFSSWDDYRASMREWLALNGTDAYLISRDKLRLHAVKVRRNSNRYAIICHGYMGNAYQMSGFANEFYKRGFNLLLPDARGHGESEGDYIGMGWPERLDILEWIEFILDENPHASILLFGISMGGATVMMTAGEDLPDNVKLIIEDCGYSSVWDQFSHNLREFYNLPRFPVMHAASAMTKLRAGYGFKEASALEQLKKSKLPILFIHGDKDDFVPFEMLERLYEAAPGEKEKLIVEGASHGVSSVTNPELYWKTIDDFMKKHGMGS